MKKIDLRDKPSAFVIGRGLIIAVVLFTSSLSFILGYFVGRTTTKETQTIRFLGKDSKGISKSPIQVAPLRKDQSQNVVSSSDKEETMQDKNLWDSKKPLTVDQQSLKSTKIVYTVQLGAFKNPLDAETLKVKFDKKGFKAFVIDSNSKNGERLYKVWVGEFATRKEAEEVSLKIKKTEGLQPFVTFKKENEIRQP
ncbi:MAG: SPOR domain-containing protein [Nitrospirae bacterium]|nr:SPOR domain-containing protein [Nitrospirota bacterium]